LRLGLLGGTFNPIHLGHLRGVEAVREVFELERVYFVPAAVPPHKNEKIEVSAAHRFEMARLAIEDNPGFRISDIELTREGKSYSIDTLHHFRKQYPGAELYFVVGLDSFLEVMTWKRYQDLFSVCHFVVLNRIGSERGKLKALASHPFWAEFRHLGGEKQWIYSPSGLSTHFLDRPLMDISSSEIRERIRGGRSVRYMMQEKVEAYVNENGFYTKSGVNQETST
jgi:nicotinate-nucleotide adenylyltransferase